MARGKKAAKALTLEEKLEQALVPEEEQPYEIPGNWCWCRIGNISDMERGITFPASAKEYELTETNIPCLRTANIQEELVIDDLLYIDRNYIKNNSSKYVYSKDIIMSSANSRELVGKSVYVHDVPFPMTFGGFVLILRVKNILSKYLFYYLRFEFLFGKFMGESTQTTNIANINAKKLGNYEIPLPPSMEQQRIVTRIENLFTKLDETKEKAQAVIDGFELRKSAILHKAFTGELTERWRKKHGVGLESWENTFLSKIVFDFKYGTSEKSDYNYDGMPVIRIPNITDNGLNFEDMKFLAHYNIPEENQICENDILIIRSNGSRELVGKSALVPKLEKIYTYASFLIRIRPRDVIIPKFLVLCLNSFVVRSQLFQKAKSSAGINNINSKELGAITLKLPSIPEQSEIICLLDNLFVKEHQAKQAAESVLAQIDTMKKAILARAFRGELGTNNPSDENAIELLKKVLAEKN